MSRCFFARHPPPIRLSSNGLDPADSQDFTRRGEVVESANRRPGIAAHNLYALCAELEWQPDTSRPTVSNAIPFARKFRTSQAQATPGDTAHEPTGRSLRRRESDPARAGRDHCADWPAADHRRGLPGHPRWQLVLPAGRPGPAGERQPDRLPPAGRGLAVRRHPDPLRRVGGVGCRPGVLAAGVAAVHADRHRPAGGAGLPDPQTCRRRQRRQGRLRPGRAAGRRLGHHLRQHVHQHAAGRGVPRADGEPAAGRLRAEGLVHLERCVRQGRALRRTRPDQQGQHRPAAGGLDLPPRRLPGQHRRRRRGPDHPAAGRRYAVYLQRLRQGVRPRRG
ncbi:hypothetical protein D3C78_1006190 [compost metagenome]